jgi:hypothetical protein
MIVRDSKNLLRLRGVGAGPRGVWRARRLARDHSRQRTPPVDLPKTHGSAGQASRRRSFLGGVVLIFGIVIS